MGSTMNESRGPALKLSKRLRAVAEWIVPGNVVADIGTDHGYLPIYIVKNQISNQVIAMDVRKGPLEKARKNAAEYLVSDKIQIRLSDGLNALEPMEAQTVTICGMGGRLMQRILEEGADKISAATQLILSPQSEIRCFRQYLFENGFVIEREDMLREDGQFYLLMECYQKGPVRMEARLQCPDWTQKQACVESSMQQETFLRFGQRLLESRNQCLKEYLQREYMLAEKVYESVRRADIHEDAVRKRLRQLKADMDCIKYALKYYA